MNYDTVRPKDSRHPNTTNLRHRPIDLVEEFHDEDLAIYATCAELAADHPELDIIDLCELYGAADTAREAVRISRRRKGRN